MRSGRFMRSARRAALGLVLLAPVFGAVGCEGNGAKSQASIAEAYDAGRYEEAYDKAVKVAGRTSGVAKEEASLYAGLSAREMGNTDEAVRWLQPLTTIGNASVAGRASQALGLIEMDRGNNDRAIRYFDIASRNLTGDDAARSEFYAGQALEAAGRSADAKRRYQTALSMAFDDILKSDIEARLGTSASAGGGSGGFSVQLGAFSSRANADRAAAEFAGVAAGLGYEPPRVATKVDNAGRTLYVVLCGRFPSLQEASQAKKQFPKGAFAAAAPD